MRFIILFYPLYFINLLCYGQHQSYSSFTVKDGLPSNYIYACVEDNKGFLWVATDAGVARFDGKHFQVFTTLQGLPDNEVLSIVKEKNGRIWVNCFKQSPAYFDELKNRFINSKEDTTLGKVSGTGVMYLYSLHDGGVMYYNESGSHIFKNNKLIEFKTTQKEMSFVIRSDGDGNVIRYGSILSDTHKMGQPRIYQFQKNKLVDSADLIEKTDALVLPAINENNFYLFILKNKKILRFSNIQTNPFRFKKDSVMIDEPATGFGFTNKYITLYGNSGKVYVIDKKTFAYKFNVSGDYAPNTLYEDIKGNVWVSTIDKGLILYKKKPFNNPEMPVYFNHTNFLSIARTQDGRILAGNFYGEVVELDNKKIVIHTVSKSLQAITRQRKIIISNNKIFTFSETGVFVNYTTQLITKISSLFYAKTAINYNDSLMMVGYVGGICRLNSRTFDVSKLNTPYKRVTALSMYFNDILYFGSTDGLYKYNFKNNTTEPLNKTHSLLNERVVALSKTSDSLLWIATPGSGVVAIKNDQVLLNITSTEGIINNACRSITAGRPGQIWLGTSEGISIIDYKLNGSKINYKVQNLSVNDGLTSNVINEMLYQNDTIYAATADGISVIPANTSIPVFSIPVQVISVSINQRDTIVASQYDLNTDQQNIRIGFAGIELGGHFKNLQYTADNNKNWIDLFENTLNLQLTSGHHTIQVRAVDVNGNISDKILSIEFNIATPFWKAAWFWITMAIGLQLLTILLVIRWQKKRKKTKLAKDLALVQNASLEQQAFTSLLNPHFMFNALNSIQHYINVQDRKNANRYLSDFASLIRKNFEAAQKSFIPLEQELENLKLYLRLEQMRFSNRFAYEISTNENVDIDQWMIPTMMLQPLLENALLHGIMPSSIDGNLIIDLSMLKECLLITITDNGIGIENSMALKQNDDHKSHGMQLILKRITALNHFVSEPVIIKMSPAFTDDKNPGNKIKLLIPDDLYGAWQKAQL